MRTVLLALLWSGCTSTVDPASPRAPGVGTEGLSPKSPTTNPAEEPPLELASFENPPLVSVPVFGGTLEGVPDLHGALASDPEGNRLVWMPTSGAPIELSLGANARPFRIEVEGSRAWVTLRGTGEVMAVDLPGLTPVWRTAVCPEPRGLDHGPDGSLVVACAGGELVALDDASGEVDRWRLLPPDLRDVVSADGILYVSRFRPGEVLLVDPATLERFDVAPLGVSGRVAWRMRADPGGEGALVVYDEPSDETIEGSPGDSGLDESSGDGHYGSSDSADPCNARHQVHFARVVSDGFAFRGAGALGVVLPVDFLVRGDGTVVLAAAGGNPLGQAQGLVDLGRLEDVLKDGDCIDGTSRAVGLGLASALAEVDGDLWVQTASHALVRRTTATDGELATVWDDGVPAPLPNSPVILFHRDPGTAVACASCHPEGQDDGQVWQFGRGIDGVAAPGPRRTLPLAGHLLDRGPYHWMGELQTPGDLMESTFTSGMAGGEVPPEDSTELFQWLDGLRPVHRTSGADAETLAMGEEVFVESGCGSCHGGVAFTSNEVTTVRAGLPSKVPTLLGLGMHTSFMHDGCAPTLLDRFLGTDACTGGDQHGAVSLLSEEEVLAVVAYLETL